MLMSDYTDSKFIFVDLEAMQALYEIDGHNRVRRHCMIDSKGINFVPEDIQFGYPLNPDAMLSHPSAKEIESDEFESLWGKWSAQRKFLTHLPNDLESRIYGGIIVHGGRYISVMWEPSAKASGRWIQVTGFSKLFASGGHKDARDVALAIFMEKEIEWHQEGGWIKNKLNSFKAGLKR